MQSDENIRNFVIIAHVDHGKSTLADRFLEITGTVDARHMQPQYLDQLELERERGITIKMAPVRMLWHPDRRLAQTETQTNADSDLLYEDLTYRIRGAIFAAKKSLGLGHKEAIYQKALEEEFGRNNLQFNREKILDIFYGDKKIGVYRPDFVVDEKVILEIKSLPFIGKNEEQQVWSYLKGSSYKLALLVNFGGSDVEIKRIIFDSARFQRGSAFSPQSQRNSELYVLNLIDTPGHSDFSYEVSRALAAVEGAILLVDATQGIQAQTLAVLDAAQKTGLTIIGAVNKIDIATKDQIESAVNDLAHILDISKEEIFSVSGKTGDGADRLLSAVIEKVPSPENANQPRFVEQAKPDNICVGSHKSMSRALIFDSLYDDHKGVIAFIRCFDGKFKFDDNFRIFSNKTIGKIKEVGYFKPELCKTDEINSGEIGYVALGIKDPGLIKIGDTLFSRIDAGIVSFAPLVGYKEPRPVIFVSLYPEDADKYGDLKKALDRLRLTDAALAIEPDYNEVLGRGFKVGFLGKLHFEITIERIKRESELAIINSFPSVPYRVTTKNGEIIVKNPKDFPSEYIKVFEPITKITIMTSQQYFGQILQLNKIFRLSNIETESFSNKMLIKAYLPLVDLIGNFNEELKSVSSGFASLNYDIVGEAEVLAKKMDIFVAKHLVPGLTRIINENCIERKARQTVEALKKILPRQQYAQAVQAVVDNKVVARETIPALRKDVTGYLYGGDRTRKAKLWKKQQKGKKRLKGLAEKSPIKMSAEVFKELLKI